MQSNVESAVHCGEYERALKDFMDFEALLSHTYHWLFPVSIFKQLCC